MKNAQQGVSFVNYEGMLDEVEALLPEEAKVLFLTDRGFCAFELLRALQCKGWSFRIRTKGRSRLQGVQRREFQPKRLALKEGSGVLYRKGATRKCNEDNLLLFFILKYIRWGGKRMGLPNNGWANKKGTASRDCNCGSWKQHWINFTKDEWPSTCSVFGCNSSAELGAHVYHPDVEGERIAPMCDSCNKKTDIINLKGSTKLPKANISQTCGKIS